MAQPNWFNKGSRKGEGGGADSDTRHKKTGIPWRPFQARGCRLFGGRVAYGVAQLVQEVSWTYLIFASL